ncbi:transposase [Nonomuraea gerenzanensis]|nr:transposase [Nonomuraea gerenzanensis]
MAWACAVRNCRQVGPARRSHGGRINAAQILSEWGECRQAYAGPDSIAALAGICPVTRASGRHRAVGFRWALQQEIP